MNKKIVTLILILAIAMSLACLCYLVLLPKQEPQVVNNQPDNDNVDTSDWKTYRNEEYGFEIKIPENWEESKTDIGINEENKNYLIDYVSFNDYQNKNSKNALPLLSIAIVDKNRIKEEINYGDLLKSDSRDVLDYKKYLDSSYFGYSVTAVFDLKNNNELIIRLSNIEDEKIAMNILEDILKLLKLN